MDMKTKGRLLSAEELHDLVSYYEGYEGQRDGRLIFDNRFSALMLSQVRNKRGLSQKELGEKAGYTEKQIAEFEDDDCLLDEETLNKLSEALEVSVFALLYPDIYNSTDVMHVFFLLEENYHMQVQYSDTGICLNLGKGTDSLLYYYLQEWIYKKQELQQRRKESSSIKEDQQIKDDYTFWKWRFPLDTPTDKKGERRKALLEKLKEIQEELKHFAE